MWQRIVYQFLVFFGTIMCNLVMISVVALCNLVMISVVDFCALTSLHLT